MSRIDCVLKILYNVKILGCVVCLILGVSSSLFANAPRPIQAPIVGVDSPNQTQIKSSQEFIVSIKVRSAVTAYSAAGSFFGTGCIIDKKNGLLLTNAHVTGVDNVAASYEVTLYNGKEIKARLFYFDPWHDFAFLKVDPADLHDIHSEMQPSFDVVASGEPVYIIGKNENKHFSVQTGTIANYYESSGNLPNQVFRISLNAQGGASGSPVFNNAGKVIGLVHASNTLTSALALPVAYAYDALAYFQQNKKPARHSTGIVVEYLSLDDAVRFYSFPSKMAEKYLKRFPDSFNRILIIQSILAGTPAEKSIQVGDVIISVNGIEIGPDLYKMDQIVNEAILKNPEKLIEFKVIRIGEEKTIQLASYDLSSRKINKLVSFGGAIFYEADDAITYRTGVVGHRVFITNIRAGSSFFEKMPVLPNSTSAIVAVSSINGKQIQSLDDIIAIIPALIKQQDFHMVFHNYGVDFGFNNSPIFSQGSRIQHISYNRSDGLPELYKFNDKTHEWKVDPILEN